MLNSGLSSSGVSSSGGSRGGVSSRNVQSSDNRKIQGLRGDQVHIDPVLEIVKAPGARGLRALGLRVSGFRALGFRAGRLCAGRLHACMAHSRGLRGRGHRALGHRALVQRDWPRRIQVFLRKILRHPRKQHNIFRKDALALPRLPRLPSSVRVLMGGLGLSPGISLVFSPSLSLVLCLGLSTCSTGKRQTDNRQERAQGNCGNFLAFNTANDGGFPVLFAARALHRRRRHGLRRHDVGAAEDVRGRESVHVCRDGGSGRAHRQRCQIERHLRSVVAPAKAIAQGGDTAVPELLQGTGDGHEGVEGRGGAVLELGGGRGGDVFGAVS